MILFRLRMNLLKQRHKRFHETSQSRKTHHDSLNTISLSLCISWARHKPTIQLMTYNFFKWLWNGFKSSSLLTALIVDSCSANFHQLFANSIQCNTNEKNRRYMRSKTLSLRFSCEFNDNNWDKIVHEWEREENETQNVKLISFYDLLSNFYNEISTSEYNKELSLWNDPIQCCRSEVAMGNIYRASYRVLSKFHLKILSKFLEDIKGSEFHPRINPRINARSN